MPGTNGSNAGVGKKKQDVPIDSHSRRDQRRGRGSNINATGNSSNHLTEGNDRDKRTTQGDAENGKRGGLFGSLFGQVKTAFTGNQDTQTDIDQSTKDKSAKPERPPAEPPVDGSETSERPKLPQREKPKVDFATKETGVGSTTVRDQPQSSRNVPGSEHGSGRGRPPKQKKVAETHNPSTTQNGVVDDTPVSAKVKPGGLPAEPAVERSEPSEKPALPKRNKPRVSFAEDETTAGSITAREQLQGSRPVPDSQSKSTRMRPLRTRRKDDTDNPPTMPDIMADGAPEPSTNAPNHGESGSLRNIPEILVDEVPSPTKEDTTAQEKGKRAAKDRDPGSLRVPTQREAEKNRRRGRERRPAKEERRKSRRISLAENSEDRRTKQASRSVRENAARTRPKRTTPTVRDTGIQAEVPFSTQGTFSDNHTHQDHEPSFNNTTAATLGTSTQLSSNNSQMFSGEYTEARCAVCGFIIYVDPKTGQRVDLVDPPRELCFVCGQPWPLGKPLTQEMEELIKSRAENSPFKDVLCKRCASTIDAGGEVDDRGVEIDERELKENASWRDDHYCIPLDFERDEADAETQKFPRDPKWRGGTKRALLIGINYSGQKSELKGCRNDVKNMYHYLKSNGYEDKNIDILMDIKPYISPTRQNILKYMENLVREAQPGDYLFLHYSGHGGQTKDWEGDEPDGKDECIYPVDHKGTSKGMIVDDQMHNLLAKIPKGSQLTALFDSCHSGSVLDLPYALANDRMVKVDFRKKYATEILEALNKGGTIVLWSGCQDTQTSADAKIKGTAVGAMSSAFIEANWDLLKEKNGGEVPPPTSTTKKSSKVPWTTTTSTSGVRDYTYDELLDRIRAILKKRSQVAQLSSTEGFNPTKKKVYV